MSIKIRNIGHITQAWLAELDIFTQEDIKKTGSVQIYMQVKARRRVSKNLLWALEGAALDCDWRTVPPKRKQELLEELSKIDNILHRR